MTNPDPNAIGKAPWWCAAVGGSRSPSPRQSPDDLAARLVDVDTLTGRIARDLVDRIRDLTRAEHALETEIAERVAPVAPTLLAICGVGAVTAAKIIGEVADVRRFRSKDAFARHNGTSPIPVHSGNCGRYRLSRTGNRQLNAAIHRIAITQIRWHPDAAAYRDRRLSAGKTKPEALRALKRRLSDVVYRALLADADRTTAEQTPTMAA